MKKLFLILGMASIFTVLATGIGFYWVSSSSMETANRNAISAVAKGAAVAIAQQTQQLTQFVQGVAQSNEVQHWVKQKDLARLEIINKRYESILPGAMKIRILLPETTQLDTRHVPHLGYADLDMVQETFKANQKPVVQGNRGPNRHLAIARGVVVDDQVVAVVLASLKYDYIKASLNKVVAEGGRIVVKQGDVLLASAGVAAEDGLPGDAINVTGTGWVAQMQKPSTSNIVRLGVYSAILIIAVTLVSIFSMFVFKRLSDFLRSDQRSILKITKDLMSGQIQGNYPVHLDELRVVVSTVSQYKRIIADGASMEDIAKKDNEEELTLINFFDDFSDAEEGAAKNKSKPATKAVEKTDSQPLSPEDFFKDDTKSSSQIIAPQPINIYQSHEIRGIVGKTLSTDIISDVGRAMASELKEKGFDSVVIARDGRESSMALRGALVKGLTSTGINVLDIGMVPTPILYFVAHYHESRSGIMITGGHHPAEYNGLKMVIDGELLSDKRIQQLKQRIDQGDFISGDFVGSVEADNIQVNEYIGAISEDLHIARQMKVVVDCGNGVTGELAPTVLKTLGCEVVELHCDIDGKFPNHAADPSNSDNLTDLITAVGHYRADVGIAFDGDGDRLGVVDSNGAIIWPDRQLMLYAKDVLKLIPGAKIIYDTMCTSKLADEISKYGGQPIMAKTGHSFMRRLLKNEGANLAGEMSGHILFNDRWFGFDDAIYSAARLIEILSVDSRPSQEVFADLPTRQHEANYTLPMSEAESVKFVARLSELAIFPEGKITCLDCLRVDFADGWGVARPSRSTPAVVLRFEADSKEALQRIKDGFKQNMADAKPGMKIPF